MRWAAMVVAVVLVGCVESAPSDMERRALEAVDRFGRSDLTVDEREAAAGDLLDMCESGAESWGYRLGMGEAAPELLEALGYVCPDVVASIP